MAGIKAAGEAGDWRAWAKFLELSYPEYRQPNTKVEVNTNTQAAVLKLVCTPEQAKALREARERLLQGPKNPAQCEQPKLQAGTPIGPTILPEDPKITMMKELESFVTYDQIISGAHDIGRFGNID